MPAALLSRKPSSLLEIVPAPKLSFPGWALALAIRSLVVLISLAELTMRRIMVNSASEIRTTNDLIAKAKAQPGKLNFGAGTISSKLLGFLLNKAAGINTVLVPYNGSAEVTQGLLTKSVDFTLDGTSAAASLIQSGQFRVLAKFDDRPLPLAPDVPVVQKAVPNL